MMDCPKCMGRLDKKQMENVEVDVCFVCEGIWFDSNELKEVIEKDSENFNFIDIGRESFDGIEAAELQQELNKKEGKCPRCNDGTLLLKNTYKDDVIIDVCPKGHGTWLDGSEILKLRNRGKVKLHDQIQWLKYMFSAEGFNDFIKSFRKR